ncbi:MAG: phosphotransferase [Novosphingobium sp.]|nr:phosphotransferase [Novosphingobium sp.]
MSTTETVSSRLPIRIEELTAEWLTKALSENYPGTVVTEAHIGTVISGTATKVRLLLSYNADGHRHRLPPTMWVKGGFIRHDYTYDNSFVQEAKFFATWGKQLDINIPKAYWSDWEDGVQGLVLLEDLAARNATFGRATSLISIDQQAQALVLLAKMHARWWESPELKTLKNFSNAWEAAGDIVMQMLRPDYFDACINHRRCAAYTGPYRDRERIMAGLRKQWARGRDIPQVFCHGDAHLGNMFFEHDGTPGYLDWQAWQEGPYMHDVAYAIIGNLKVEDRRHAEKDLLAGYLAALKTSGVANPPSFDDAWEAYRRHAMHGFMWPFTPEEMQPLDIVTAEGDCFGAAVADLDTFGALGV